MPTVLRHCIYLVESKMDKYDVVIIGGGLGGLSCGVLLSKNGLRVCILEQHSVVGGCLQSFRRGQYILDTGMHYVGSLSEGQIMHQYFKYFGIVDKLHLQKLDESGFDRFLFKDGTKYAHAMGYERFVDTLATEFPDEYIGLKRLSESIKRIGGFITPNVLKSGNISNGGIEYVAVSANDEICRHIKNPILRNVVAGNCTLFAGEKKVSSLYEYGMITNSNIEGAHCFKNGSQQLADALTDEVRHNGGDVITKAKVSKIHLNGDRVDYVELESGERYTATNIISSLHPQQTFSILENNSIIRKVFFSRINSMRNTYGIFSTYLLIKPNSLKYENHNSYLINNPDVWSAYGDWKGYNIPTVLMCMQPSINSKYTNVVTLLTPMPIEYCERWIDTCCGKRGAEYQEFKERFSEAVIDFTLQFCPDLKKHIQKVCTASPLTYRDYTLTPDGSAYGIVKDFHNPMVTMFPAKTRISNLLLTGQNMNIHGCLGTTISAAITCSEILGKEYLAKQIGNA